MTADKETIARRITQLREAKGMTQIELAYKTGISEVSISAWERGKRVPTIRSLMLLAAALDCSPYAFLEDVAGGR